MYMNVFGSVKLISTAVLICIMILNNDATFAGKRRKSLSWNLNLIMVSIAYLALVRILSHCLWCLTCKLSVFFFKVFPSQRCILVY